MWLCLGVGRTSTLPRLQVDPVLPLDKKKTLATVSALEVFLKALTHCSILESGVLLDGCSRRDAAPQLNSLRNRMGAVWGSPGVSHGHSMEGAVFLGKWSGEEEKEGTVLGGAFWNGEAEQVLRP